MLDAFTLREDQAETLRSVEAAWSRGAFRVCAVDPTGTGKTHRTAAMMVEKSLAGQHILFACHRRVLADQTSDRLMAAQVNHGVCYDGSRTNDSAHIHVGCSASFVLPRNLDLVERASIIVIDECHRGEHDRLLKVIPRTTRVLGLTATPENAGAGLAGRYDAQVVGMKPSEAIARGLIVRPRIYAPMRVDTSGVTISRATGEYVQSQLEAIVGGVVRDAAGVWERMCRGKRTIAFCVGVDHAEQFAAACRERGARADVIVAGTHSAARMASLKRLAQGAIDLVVNVAVLAEGADVPSVECVLMLAPVASVPRWIQTAGRGCRAFPGKDGYDLIDCTGSVFNPMLGDPSADREWIFDKVRARRDTPPVTQIRSCQKCFMVFQGRQCPACDGQDAPYVTLPRTHDGQLVRVSVPTAQRERKVKEEPLEITDRARLKQAYYRKLAGVVRKEELDKKVSEAVNRAVPLNWRGRVIMVPFHNAMLW